MLIIPGVEPDVRMHAHVLMKPLVAPRCGIMLHYDDSSSDASALAWFNDPRCTNGYTWLVLDDGRVVELADPGMRTPHAGPCRMPNANSRLYGIAAATNGSVCATERQLDAIATGALHGHHATESSPGCGTSSDGNVGTERVEPRGGARQHAQYRR